MKISINGTLYQLPGQEERKLLEMAQARGLEQYDNLSSEMRLIAKPIARKILQDQEKKVMATHGKEVALLFRPDKKADAVVHLSKIMMAVIQEALKDATLAISTDADSITALSFEIKREGESGGPLVTDGNIGERKDNRAEIS